MNHVKVETDAESLKDAPRWIIWGMAFINRTGFPIVVCVFLAWFLLFKMDDYRAESQRTAQMIVEAVRGNTGVVSLLAEAVNRLDTRRRGHGG